MTAAAFPAHATAAIDMLERAIARLEATDIIGADQDLLGAITILAASDRDRAECRSILRIMRGIRATLRLADNEARCAEHAERAKDSITAIRRAYGPAE